MKYYGIIMFAICGILALLPLDVSAVQTVTQKGIKVCLLDVRKLNKAERETDHGISEDGVRCVFFVENEPGRDRIPIIGEIQVSFSGVPYNEVANASSSKPFSPDLIVYDVKKFETTDDIKKLIPSSRPGAVSVIIEAIVRGKMIKDLEAGMVEFEFGDVTATDGQSSSKSGEAEYTKFAFKLSNKEIPKKE
jgi:hypothetical protein